MPAARDIQRLAVRDSKAADMLDLPTAKFRRLVAQGALPGPVRIGDVQRWRVDQIEAIISGDAARPNEDIEL